MDNFIDKRVVFFIINSIAKLFSPVLENSLTYSTICYFRLWNRLGSKSTFKALDSPLSPGGITYYVPVPYINWKFDGQTSLLPN